MEQQNQLGIKLIIIIVVILVILIGAGLAWYFFIYESEEVSEGNSVSADTIGDTVTNIESTNKDEITDGNVTSSSNYNSNSVSITNLEGRTIDIEEGIDYVCMHDVMVDVIAFMDSDNDLIMAEFEDLWGTKDTSKDTDGDTYGDLSEIQACYDPTGAGAMNGDYFESTFCPKWWEMALSHAEADEDTYDLFMAIIPDYCGYWSSYADYYVTSLMEGVDIWDLITDEGSDAYQESCQNTLADSNLTDFFNYIFEINVEPDDRLEIFCGIMIDVMSSMCGEYAGC